MYRPLPRLVPPPPLLPVTPLRPLLTPAPPPPSSLGRYQAAVTVLNGLVYAVGGCDSWNCLSSVEVYDPARDVWSFVAPMATPRRGSGVSRVNGQWGGGGDFRGPNGAGVTVLGV